MPSARAAAPPLSPSAVAAARPFRRRRVRWAGLALAAGVMVASGACTSASSTATGGANPGSVPGGKTCVPVSGPLPKGAPEVPVEVGPAPTALVSRDLVVGTGAEVKPGAIVTVDYIGVACTTGTVFDSSYTSGEPATFPLGSVIKGWTNGLPGMKVGGTRLLGIPADQAYGARSPSPDIGPNEPLWFVVEMKATT